MGEVVDDSIKPLGPEKEVLAHLGCIHSMQHQA